MTCWSCLLGGYILRKAVQIHAKEIYLENPVNVMEFIFVPTIVLFKVIFINLVKVVEVVRTFRIHVFVDKKMFAVFLGNQQ